MKYYKQVCEDHIVLVGIDCGGIEISENEYTNIMNMVLVKPDDPSGFVYMLNNSLVWELVELPDLSEDDLL